MEKKTLKIDIGTITTSVVITPITNGYSIDCGQEGLETHAGNFSPEGAFSRDPSYTSLLPPNWIHYLWEVINGKHWDAEMIANQLPPTKTVPKTGTGTYSNGAS